VKVGEVPKEVLQHFVVPGCGINILELNKPGVMRRHVLTLYNLVRNLRPACLLEIGTGEGVSTLAMSQAVRDAQRFDDNQYQCDFNTCDINPDVQEVGEHCPAPVRFHIMPSDDLANVWEKPIQFMFVDGCHKYEQVLRDFYNYWRWVSVNGFILFHDTWPPSDEYATEDYSWDAHKIIDNLRMSSVEMVTLPFSFGLTICRKLA
jgi:predicted O-methyltransferase YrrM